MRPKETKILTLKKMLFGNVKEIEDSLRIKFFPLNSEELL
jgi:hypothetical protein